MTYYIIIRGPLGCGKTTISRRLAQILNAKYFAIDDVLKKYNLEKDREKGYISQKSFKKANDIIVPEAKKILHEHKPVVFDGNFYWKSQITDLIKRLTFPHYVFTLKAPLGVCIERDKKRRKPYGEKAAKDVYKKSTDLKFGVTIQVSKPIKECIEEIVFHIEK